jgi:MerR family transcriptional regulator, heat shock protein HspR
VSEPRVDTRPLFMIGVAAELAGMHPQTLRVYERRGLVRPSRTARNTRLYSQADVALLARIQSLSDSGLNLAGIERVMALERDLARASRRIASLEAELADQAQEIRREKDRLRRASNSEIVLVRRQSMAVAPRYAPAVPTGRRQ